MRVFTIILIIFLLLTPVVRATELVDTQGLTEELGDEISQSLPKFDPQQPADFWESLKTMFFDAFSKASETMNASLRLCAVLIALLTLCAVVRMSGLEHASNAVIVAGSLAITTAMLGSFHSMVLLAENTVKDMSDYSACFLPVMASATIACGGISSAAALYSGTVMFIQVAMQLITKLLIPFVYFYIAIATAEAALSSDTLSEIREFVGWLISKSLRIVMYIFIAYMSITGVIGGSSDAATLKATKAAVSGMIPVVGNIVSDASESLIASAGLLKSSVGVFGMLAIIAICLVPFLRVGIQHVILKVTTAICGTVGLASHVKLLKNFSQAMGYLLGMCGACALMLLISTVCFLKVVI